ncbi:MFS transporter [Caballeronia sp. LZ002]|uniref:MFS transporter n=1 Tax=Caballeronia sp. LZ002 TaxID=3038558 RepID=UPI002854FEDD|nr:MFS transporter [Caballeronia sp. LZ002]MDR5777322.1 MFS transporter [Caballeronia sp. LZ002]
METTPEEIAVSRKVFRHLMWFLVLLFICSYLDRINISFAALTMNRDLGLNATTFGIAGSMFYVMYVVAEIPSNLVMQRVGAKLWIPRIMITWGLASMACIFAVGPRSLYLLRALLGLAEAGFMPGILLYLTCWFPESCRARASTLFIMAQPVTTLFGSAVSGSILGMDGFLGLAGWRWLFIFEGVPSVILGVVAFFILANRPEEAMWLNGIEKATLRFALERDDRQATARAGGDAGPAIPVWRQLSQLPLILLGLCYFGLVMSLSTNSTWVPQIVRGLAPHAGLFEVGIIAAVPSLVTIVAMSLWGAHSDRNRERKWHVAIPMLVAAAGWLTVARAPTPALRFAGLILCSAGTFSAQAIFWTLAPQYLSLTARAAGIAAINVVGMLGTAVGPAVIGGLHDLTGDFGAGLSFVAVCVLVGALCTISILQTSAPRELPLTRRGRRN